MNFPKGNIAKYFIYKEISNKLLSNEGAKIKIVDIGCSNGSQWDWLYHSKWKDAVEFYGFDIDSSAIAIAKEGKPDWNFYAEPAYNITRIVSNVDIITSLSALEHVYQREEFLKSAKESLAKKGLFYLNYDNGHFFSSALGEKKRNILGPILAKLGWENWYQSFVWQDEIEEYIHKLQFTVHNELNFHQATNKQFHKAFVDENIAEYMELWLKYELEINNLLKKNIPTLRNSNSNQYLLSKLYILTHQGI